MIETLLILFLVIAVLFFIITVIWKSLAIGVMTMVLWFILAISVYNYEIPYQAVMGDNTISTGVQVINTMGIYSYIFVGMGVITLLFLLVEIILPMFWQRYHQHLTHYK